MARSRVVAVDRPWSAAHPDRTAVAVLNASGAWLRNRLAGRDTMKLP